MLDVLIVGAGPAGTVAATVLARNGARVRIVDRARFPRDKLCGDTVNPGTLALLRPARPGRSARDARPADRRHDRDGRGRRRRREPLSRRSAGPRAGPPRAGLVAAAAGDGRRRRVRAVHARSTRRRDRRRRRRDRRGRATTDRTIPRARRHRRRRPAFDARLRARARAASRTSATMGDRRVLRERRPASSPFGEMHVRRGGYIGVAPIPGGLTNVCLVKPWEAPEPAIDGATFRDPEALLRRELARDPMLRERFAGRGSSRRRSCSARWRLTSVLTRFDGLLLAGDAAGFIDPMTGRRPAIRGAGRRARGARGARRRSSDGWTGVHARLARERRREFATKWRFNRTLRTLVSFAGGRSRRRSRGARSRRRRCARSCAARAIAICSRPRSQS